jgi:hypothetical protein
MVAFFSAVFGAMIGSLFIILATKRIEQDKLNVTALAYVDSLYIELEDLKIYSKRSIELLIPVFCRLLCYKAGEIENSQLYPLSIPRKYPPDILYKHYENCMLKLSLEQRNALRTLQEHLCELNGLLEEVINHRTKMGDIDAKKLHLCISILCSVYHLSNDMALQKDRFKVQERSGEEIYRIVLKLLGFDSSYDGMWELGRASQQTNQQ